MNDNKNNSGFVWGLLIGAAIGSLISTEKGRRIIKELSEHGIESIENLMDIEEIKNVMDAGVEKGKEILNDEKLRPDAVPEDSVRREGSARREEVTVTVKKKPRFFRGIRK